MSESEETYCRLCAEPTPKEQLICTEDDVAVTSKILTKMLWINVDVSTSNALPNTICFSCFDHLEKTYMFLHNVRTAQRKLTIIFSKKSNHEIVDCTIENKEIIEENVAKPVDEDWESFQVPKKEVKDENQTDIIPKSSSIDDSNSFKYDVNLVKEEIHSDDNTPLGECNNIDTEGFNTTDSDLPLHLTIKKKKLKKKKIKLDSEILDLEQSELSVEGVLAVPLTTTWDDYMCRCANCDAQCKNISSLRLHSLQIHSCCCVFKCSDCSKVVPNYKSFVNHVRIHEKILRYCCEFCNKRFNMSASIKKHLTLVHRDAYLTMCPNCGLNFETPEELQDHILIYSKSYKKHNRKQQRIQLDLKCEHCNKEFKSRSNLQQHKLVHTERSRDFSCHVCGKMFFTKGTLINHMLTHEDTKPYKCEFCSMAFRARGNLQSHISLHSGAKPFVCEQCGKSFRVKRHLKSHSIVHTDLMPYVCEYCNKPFRFKTRLNLHLRQHTGAKPYNCVYCQRDFTNGSNFKKHMKRRHNIDTSKKKYNNIVNNVNLESNENIHDSPTQT